MSARREFCWYCLTCGEAGVIFYHDEAETRLMCRAANQHAYKSEFCPSVEGADVFVVPGGCFIQAYQKRDHTVTLHGN